MKSFSSPYPLEGVSEIQLQKLCRVLWGWKICNSCENGEGCTTTDCSWPRSGRLARFFQYYKEVTAHYVPELLSGSHPALRTHEDLHEIIKVLKTRPDVPRSRVTTEYFSTRNQGKKPLPPPADQNRAFSIAVRVFAMLNCSDQNQSSDLLEFGSRALLWRNEMTLSQFMEQAFPKTDHPNLNETDHFGKAADIKSELRAKNLKRAAGLKFQPTDDLRNHLKLDQKQGIVEIYHHTAVLKEHLAANQPSPGDSSICDSIRFSNISRQLALEALDSMQKILFPLDSDSQSLLRSLVSKASFDPDCLRFESVPYRSEDEKDVPFHYFGSRLMDLYDEIENPRPRSWVEKWVERRSGARYVMMATLIGVIIAVILGLLGLAVGVFQAWVGYQQWQHPIGS